MTSIGNDDCVPGTAGRNLDGWQGLRLYNNIDIDNDSDSEVTR